MKQTILIAYVSLISLTIPLSASYEREQIKRFPFVMPPFKYYGVTQLPNVGMLEHEALIPVREIPVQTKPQKPRTLYAYKENFKFDQSRLDSFNASTNIFDGYFKNVITMGDYQRALFDAIKLNLALGKGLVMTKAEVEQKMEYLILFSKKFAISGYIGGVFISEQTKKERVLRIKHAQSVLAFIKSKRAIELAPELFKPNNVERVIMQE